MLKHSDDEGRGEDVQTLDNLRGMSRQIYLKIRDQLEDEAHPICWIISRFQEAFRRYIEDEIADIQNTHFERTDTLPPESAQAVGGLMASANPQITSYRPVQDEQMDRLYGINRDR